MMKKIIALLLWVSVVLSFAVISVSAKESKPKITVNIANDVILDEFNQFAYYSRKLPVVGMKNLIGVGFSGFESFSYGKMTVRYNDKTVSFCKVNIPSDLCYDGFDSISYVERDYLDIKKINEGIGFAEYEIISDGRKFDATSLCTFEIATVEKGKFGLDIEFSDFKDKNGEAIEFDTEFVAIPEYTYFLDEIPEYPIFNQDNSLTYGMVLSMSYVDTELAYPMTVEEFMDSVDCGAGIGVMVDCNGNELSREDPVPTGAKFRQYFDNVILFETTMTVIGDVTCDGKITAADARKILRIAANLEKVEYDNLGIAIRNAANPAQGKGLIEAKDARAVLRYAAGLENSYAQWYRYHCLLNKYSSGLYNTNIK